MSKRSVGIFILIIGLFVLVISIIGLIITRANEELTYDERFKLLKYRGDVTIGILESLDRAEAGTNDIKRFVKEHPAMQHEEFGDGPKVLLWLAQQWKDLEESQNVRPKHTADIYLFFIDLYPDHKEVPEMKRWLKLNDYD